MKTIETMKLEMSVAAQIRALVEDALGGRLYDLTRSDLDGVCEALAIKLVRQAREP